MYRLSSKQRVPYWAITCVFSENKHHRAWSRHQNRYQFWTELRRHARGIISLLSGLTMKYRGADQNVTFNLLLPLAWGRRSIWGIARDHTVASQLSWLSFLLFRKTEKLTHFRGQTRTVARSSRWQRSCASGAFQSRLMPCSAVGLVISSIQLPFPLFFSVTQNLRTTMYPPPNELYTAFSFIGFILCVIPLYWHLQGMSDVFTWFEYLILRIYGPTA